MVTGNNEGTIKAQTLDNEYGYECEDIGNDGNPFTYVSVLPCDAVEICREQCPLCEDFINCEDFWTHYYDKHDETEGNETEDNWNNNGSYGLGGGGSSSGNNKSSMSGGNVGNNNSSITPKGNALKLINDYRKSAADKRFFNSEIYMNNFLNELEVIINNPEKISQGNNGTCGAAVLMKLLANTEPTDLVNAAINLYNTGEYRPWKWSIPDIMRNCTQEQLEEIKMNSANAIIQTGITNGNNSFLDYNANTDNQKNEDGLKYYWDGNKSFMWDTYIPNFIKEHYPSKFITTLVNPEYSTIKNIDYSQEFIITAVDCDKKKFCSQHAISNTLCSNSICLRQTLCQRRLLYRILGFCKLQYFIQQI